ncbi:MAG: hypothetical protein VB933_09710 [Pseudomonadales bacterium]
MIPSIPLSWQAETWQAELSNAATHIKDLADILGLALDGGEWDPNPAFPMRVPMPYISRMRRGDRSDPLLRQVAPRIG